MEKETTQLVQLPVTTVRLPVSSGSLMRFLKHAFEGLVVGVFLKQRQPCHRTIEVMKDRFGEIDTFGSWQVRSLHDQRLKPDRNTYARKPGTME